MEKVFGIYSPLDWHEIKKPTKDKMQYKWCPECNSNRIKEYNKWYREKKKLQRNLT